MSQFKIGETVKVTGNDSGDLHHYYDIGTEGKIVSERSSSGHYEVENLDREASPSWQYVNASDLERVIPEFTEGQRVRVAEGAKRRRAGSDTIVDASIGGQTATVRYGGLDPDGDVTLTLDNGGIAWAMPQYLTPVEDEPVEESEVEVGGRYKITAHDRGWVGLPYGTEVTVAGSDKPIHPDGTYPETHYLVTVEHDRASGMTAASWNGNGTAWVTADQVEKIEQPEPEPEEWPCQYGGTCTTCPKPEQVEETEDQDQPFKIGDRVRVSGDPGGNPVSVGDTGTVTVVNVSNTPGVRYIVTVEWDKGDTFGLFNFRLEKIETEAEAETKPEFEAGDRVRIKASPEGIRGVRVPEQWVGREGEVLSHGPETGNTRVNHGGVVNTFERGEVEKVEVPEGDNDDSPVGEVPALDLSSIASLDPSKIVSGSTVDVVNHPPHYKFSNGAEVIDITENLTSNGGQAVQYIARSTRLDGNNKGDVLEDLAKARWFIDREIERVENQG